MTDIRKIRCPQCGAQDGEPIEQDVAHVAFRWSGEYQHVETSRQVTHTAYMESVEGRDGITEYICSECGCHFTLNEILARFN